MRYFSFFVFLSMSFTATSGSPYIRELFSISRSDITVIENHPKIPPAALMRVGMKEAIIPMKKRATVMTAAATTGAFAL